ncbi:hypothetical protein CDD81_3418 [Ophiocordyceps australis]|uniref:Secreted protein n=1 Tax=Ophiocordyceps australis TaxID=1399860 RepID=A0A2C5YC26_9HYPO|nr:hypothetical protein CDD81_3418 [Ophiocordyceps australis]
MVKLVSVYFFCLVSGTLALNAGIGDGINFPPHFPAAIPAAGRSSLPQGTFTDRFHSAAGYGARLDGVVGPLRAAPLRVHIPIANGGLRPVANYAHRPALNNDAAAPRLQHHNNAAVQPQQPRPGQIRHRRPEVDE